MPRKSSMPARRRSPSTPRRWPIPISSRRSSERFGSQCVVVGIDSQLTSEGYRAYQFTGDPERTRESGRDALDWVREVQERGAGEIVLNCMGATEYAAAMTSSNCARSARSATYRSWPRAARARSEHFTRCVRQAGVDAALAASVFHTGAIAIRDLEARAARRRHRGATMNQTATTGARSLSRTSTHSTSTRPEASCRPSSSTPTAAPY